MSQYEIEVKSLLVSKENAEALKSALADKGFDINSPKTSSQLNHYFTYEHLEAFHEKVLPYIPEEKKESFSETMANGSNFSIRTREANGETLLVVKASLGSDSSSNGVARKEFEIGVPLTLQELDQLLLDAGLKYQAKWSRQREAYSRGSVVVCLDKNAGYGYLAEFEKIIDNPLLVDPTREELLTLMGEVGAEELSQERLERMFAYYNEHWPEYYGTDKTFTVE
jgi:adenylate cyclase class IV